MAENLIEFQRKVQSEGNLDYPGSVSPDKNLAEIGLTRDQIKDCDFTNTRIESLTEGEARGYRMLDLANKGNFHLLLPELRSHLHGAGASKEEFDKVDAFEKYADPSSEDSRQAAWILARQVYKMRNEVDAKISSPPRGQLNYSEIKKGLSLQPNTKTFG